MKLEKISLSDIDGIFVGNEQDTEGCTGITVILAPDGAVCGVDVRGGAPATRETDLLKSEKMVEKVHCVFLSGGSAYGLEASTGIMDFLEEKGIGFNVGVGVVPIVTGACLFDLALGNSKARPNKEMGFRACEKAFSKAKVEEGNFGAGMGATIGKILGTERMMKGGLGIYGLKCGDLKVVSIVAVNALGDIIDYDNGHKIAGLLTEDKKDFYSSSQAILELGLKDKASNPFSTNTTIGCVITNAILTKAEANALASMAHDGFARTMQPSHTRNDGDTIFVLSTGEKKIEPMSIGILAAETMGKAVNSGIVKAESILNIKCAKDFNSNL